MDKKATLVVSAPYTGDQIFNLSNSVLNRDNCLAPFAYLKNTLLQKGYELSTQDIHPISQSDIVIYNEMPQSPPTPQDKEKSLLLLFESQLIRPDNWIKEYHEFFGKIFTWRDDLVDNQIYFKFNFTQQFPNTKYLKAEGREKFCTLISGHKVNSHPKELYSKRLETIKWFEKHAPEDFEYFGFGWDDFFSNPVFNKVLKKLKLFKYLPKRSSKCYGGAVNSKFETLSQFQFAICYENARDIKGYITEKIFDCFFAGCVPIYWGPDNIEQHIPKECFIDRRKFNSHEDLYRHMKSMTTEDRQKILNAIEVYLSSNASKPFQAQHFAEVISSQVP